MKINVQNTNAGSMDVNERNEISASIPIDIDNFDRSTENKLKGVKDDELKNLLTIADVLHSN